MINRCKQNPCCGDQTYCTQLGQYSEPGLPMTNPETSSDLVKRLRGKVTVAGVHPLLSEAATTIERLTARALAAEERLGRYEGALKEALHWITNIDNSAPIVRQIRTALHSSEKANG